MNWSEYTYSPVYDGGAPTTSFLTGSGSSSGNWEFYQDPTTVSEYSAQMTTAEVTVAAGDVLYFSAHSSAQQYITGVYLEDIGSVPRPIKVTATSLVVGSRKYWKLVVPTTYAGPFTLALRFDYAPPSTSYELKSLFGGYLLLEKNYIGQYFDGNTRRGGWITGSPLGSSISDYRWVGTANNSMSVYSENYQKTVHVVKRMISSILPVNQLVTSGVVYSNRPITTTKYTITYNYIP
jgi:hypothetical protein